MYVEHHTRAALSLHNSHVKTVLTVQWLPSRAIECNPILRQDPSIGNAFAVQSNPGVMGAVRLDVVADRGASGNVLGMGLARSGRRGGMTTVFIGMAMVMCVHLWLASNGRRM